LGICGLGCLWGGPPARLIRPIDLHTRPVRVKLALTDGHGKSDLPCPHWLPLGPPRRRASGRICVAGRGRNGMYGMSGADPVGDNGKASADGKDADGANGYLGADGSGRYEYVGADVSGRYWYVGTDATVGIVRRART
jgi:hypothetical protein